MAAKRVLILRIAADYRGSECGLLKERVQVSDKVGALGLPRTIVPLRQVRSTHE
jgi:hypothetical protein